jgi:general secretion pathway protein A
MPAQHDGGFPKIRLSEIHLPFTKFAIQLGVKNAGGNRIELLVEIYKRLNEINKEGKSAVVLMDEVQMLNSREIMEEFRGLLNMESALGKMVNFVFFGLPELDHVLDLDEPLKQRVEVRIPLQAYSEANADEVIRYRLNVAGCEKEIFITSTIGMICRYSTGSPRLITLSVTTHSWRGFFLRAGHRRGNYQDSCRRPRPRRIGRIIP